MQVTVTFGDDELGEFESLGADFDKAIEKLKDVAKDKEIADIKEFVCNKLLPGLTVAQKAICKFRWIPKLKEACDILKISVELLETYVCKE